MSTTPVHPTRRMLAPPSMAGLVVATILFGLSVTPSMVPRAPELQGVLSGVVGAIGYLLGAGASALGRWIGFLPSRPVARAVRFGLAAVLAAIAALCVGLASGWQNSVHAAWGLPPVEASAPFLMALIAGVVFVLLVAIGRAFLVLAAHWQQRSQRVLPPRLAGFVGLLVSLAIFAAVIDGFLVRAALRAADNGAKLADALIAPDVAPPDSPLVSGGPGSPLEWAEMGHWGRSFVSTGPTADAISAFWGEPALQPIRVYVGLNAADTPEARAQLAFDELTRLGGFERAVLVIAMPTGSGWLDPGGMDTLAAARK